MKIKCITSRETFVVRHPVLRIGRPLKECAFKFDNHPESLHLGIELNGQIISVISALPFECDNFPGVKAMRLRGVATLTKYQKKGLASKLVIEVEERLLKLKNIKLIWLNARISAKKFYETLGYKNIGETFNIKGIGIHQRLYKILE